MISLRFGKAALVPPHIPPIMNMNNMNRRCSEGTQHYRSAASSGSRGRAWCEPRNRFESNPQRLYGREHSGESPRHELCNGPL